MTPIAPSAPYVEPPRPPQRAPPARPTRSLNEYFSRLPWQEQDALLTDWYNNNRPQLLQLMREMIVDGGGDPTPENIQLLLSRVEIGLGVVPVVPNVPDNDPQRIKQEIEPKVIPPRTKQEIVPLQQNPNWSTEQQNNIPNVNDVYDVLSYDFQTHLNNRKNNYLSNQPNRPMTLDDVVYERHAQDLGFDDPEMSYYGRPEEDWPEAGIDEEAGVSINLPSFDISNPNYNPRANDGERQFQVIGTPRSVGTERSKRANRRADFIAGREAASRVVPFVPPVSSPIVPRTVLLGRAAYGSQTRSLEPRQGSALRRTITMELPPQKLDERFEDLFGV
jgi:hypothetical protein